jgi:sucrose-6F-phosphate phosphohydrolase
MNSVITFDERRLLVTDLDGTLIGGRKRGLQKLQQALEEVRESMILVYVSGQNLNEQISSIEKRQLLLPDYIISAVGTEIHRLPGEYPLDEWYRYIQAGFNREAMLTFLAEHYPQLALQPLENQTPLKVSYFWEDTTRETLDALQYDLFQAEFPCKLIYSRNVYLDIIPERAGIGPAVKFLTDSLVLSPSQVFVCGDSGNDIDLFQYGFRGIVVGNATPELKKAVELRAYFSHKSHALGLLEGLQHYKFFIQSGKPDRRDMS